MAFRHVTSGTSFVTQLGVLASHQQWAGSARRGSDTPPSCNGACPCPASPGDRRVFFTSIETQGRDQSAGPLRRESSWPGHI